MDHFNRHLPTDCVLHIFSRLPIVDLVVAGLACSRWNELHSTELRNRKSLTIVLDQSKPEHMDVCYPLWRLATDWTSSNCLPHLREPIPRSKVKFNMLTFRSLTLAKVNGLSELFPRVTTLKLALYKTNPFSQLNYCRLLESWPLIRLELYCSLISYNPQNLNNQEEAIRIARDNSQLQRTLLAKVNQQPNLRKFTYKFDRSVFGTNEILEARQAGRVYPSLDLPILGQLEEFKFQSEDCASILLESLHQYGLPNTKLRVNLGMFRTLRLLFELPNAQELTARFITLTLQELPHFHDETVRIIDWPQFHRLSLSFVALSTLSINLDSDLQYPELITNLAHLEKLTTLELKVFWHSQGAPQLNCTAVLPSVRRLLFRSLFLQINCRFNIPEYFQLGRVFPNLSLLCMPIIIWSCSNCEISDSEQPISLEKGQRCAQNRVAGLSQLLDQNLGTKIKCTFEFFCANWYDGTSERFQRKNWTCEQLGVQI